LLHLVSLSLRIKDLLGPVTRVKKKKSRGHLAASCITQIKAQGPSRTRNESKEEEEDEEEEEDLAASRRAARPIRALPPPEGLGG